MYTIGFLILAWLLSLFQVDGVFIQAIAEIFNKSVSVATYYFTFLVAGLVIDVLKRARKR